MKCHKCHHHPAVQRGEYSSKPWEGIPCAKCRLGEDTFYSIPFDEEHPPECIAGDSMPSVSSAFLPAETLGQFVQGLLSLDPILRDIVAWRYQGLPYKEIACRQGSSIQLAEMRHKRAIRDWPALRALFPEKVAKQSRRKGRA